jgi:hypothetical protein
MHRHENPNRIVGETSPRITALQTEVDSPEEFSWLGVWRNSMAHATFDLLAMRISKAQVTFRVRREDVGRIGPNTRS